MAGELTKQVILILWENKLFLNSFSSNVASAFLSWICQFLFFFFLQLNFQVFAKLHDQFLPVNLGKISWIKITNFWAQQMGIKAPKPLETGTIKKHQVMSNLYEDVLGDDKFSRHLLTSVRQIG